MARTIESTFTIGDAKLYTKTWLPAGEPKANLVFVHGFSDHINRYYEFFPTLASRGIATYGFDQRGWGRSVLKPSQRGLTGGTNVVLADIAAFVQNVLSQTQSETPLFIMGHSMGGNEVLTLASSSMYEDSVISKTRGWLLHAPFIGFAPEEQPSSLKIAAGRLAGRVMPHFHLANPIDPERLTRDPDVQKSIKDDDLLHETGTLEGMTGLLDRVGDLSSGKAKLSLKVRSLWLGHGDKDMVVSFDASRQWFERQTALKDKTFRVYENGMHVLHGDAGKEVLYKDVGDWILARCETAATTVSGKENEPPAATTSTLAGSAPAVAPTDAKL